MGEKKWNILLLFSEKYNDWYLVIWWSLCVKPKIFTGKKNLIKTWALTFIMHLLYAKHYSVSSRLIILFAVHKSELGSIITEILQMRSLAVVHLESKWKREKNLIWAWWKT